MASTSMSTTAPSTATSSDCVRSSRRSTTILPRSRRFMVLDIATATVDADKRPSSARSGPVAEATTRRYRRGRLSPLTGRILAVNVLALALLGLGLLYLGKYEASLIETELQALKTQGEIFAAALGEGAVLDSVEGEQLLPELARQMMRRLVEPTRTRARLFGTEGQIVADSRVLRGPGGVIQIRELSPPRPRGWLAATADEIYDWIVSWLPRHSAWPLYKEPAVQS